MTSGLAPLVLLVGLGILVAAVAAAIVIMMQRLPTDGDAVRDPLSRSRVRAATIAPRCVRLRSTSSPRYWVSSCPVSPRAPIQPHRPTGCPSRRGADTPTPAHRSSRAPTTASPDRIPSATSAW